jgi:hypothetical protein
MTQLLAGSQREQCKKREQLGHTHLFLSLFALGFFWEDVSNSTELCTLCQLHASASSSVKVWRVQSAQLIQAFPNQGGGLGDRRLDSKAGLAAEHRPACGAIEHSIKRHPHIIPSS